MVYMCDNEVTRWSKVYTQTCCYSKSQWHSSWFHGESVHENTHTTTASAHHMCAQTLVLIWMRRALLDNVWLCFFICWAARFIFSVLRHQLELEETHLSQTCQVKQTLAGFPDHTLPLTQHMCVRWEEKSEVRRSPCDCSCEKATLKITGLTSLNQTLVLWYSSKENMRTFLDSRAVLDAGGFGWGFGGVSVRIFTRVHWHHHIFYSWSVIFTHQSNMYRSVRFTCKL